jgi:hypothetical protein
MKEEPVTYSTVEVVSGCLLPDFWKSFERAQYRAENVGGQHCAFLP